MASNTYRFDVSCQGTVPPAVMQASVSLSPAASPKPFYKGVPESITERVFQILDKDLAAMARKFVAKING